MAKILGVVILAMFVALIIVRNQSDYRLAPEGDIETYFQQSLGEQFENLIGYETISVIGIPLIRPILADFTKIKLVEFSGSPERKLNLAITYIKQYPYVEEQSDPAIISKEFGGNCQAFSLALKAILLHNGVKSGIVFGEEHMYNWVEINDKRYLVDVVDGFIKEG